MAFENIKLEKNKIRNKYKQIRQEMSADEKDSLDKMIAKNFLNTMAYSHANQILIYASKNEEIDTKLIFEKAISDKKAVLFPKCRENSDMIFRYVNEQSDLEIGMYGLDEPIESCIEYLPKNADLCIIPALAYDVFGYRMGYGRGYYDRFLSEFVGIKVGFCYSSFIEKQLPKGRYDVKIDILVTEKGIFRLKVE